MPESSFGVGYGSGSSYTPPVWEAPTFAAGDYTASGTMAFNVDAADANVFYKIDGTTMRVSFRLGTVSIVAPLSASLYIKIPANKVANRAMAVPIWTAQPGPVHEVGYAHVGAGDNRIRLSRLAEGNWIASVNQTYIFGQIEFEIQA
jgi:hypothetical protein